MSVVPKPRPSVSPAAPPADRLQRLLAGQNEVLRLIASGRPSAEVLDRLTRVVEAMAPPAICSVLFIENGHLRHGAAPHLPEVYTRAVDGLAIGPKVGSCGTAAYRRAPVVVRDIATDPLWEDYRDFALPLGLRACWSQPILSDDGEVLGTFALYYGEPREPAPDDWELLEGMAQLVRVLIERDKRERALQEIEQRLRDRVAELEQTRERLQQKTAQLEQLAADLTQARNEAATANRMKSEFLANMSHELRTPLNAIIGFSEIIMSEMLGPLGSPTYQAYARDINDSGQHLLAIIGEVLDLSRIEAGRFELSESLIDLQETAASCTRLMRERAQSAGIELKTSLPDDLPLVYADEIKIKQVLLNLLSNAVKFTPQDGRITLTARRDADGGVVLEVTDTGIGMRSEDIPIALEPFRQIDSMLSRKYEGTGLGLPLAKAIVEHHGGRLSIETALDQGTTVTIHLPPERTVVAPRRGQG
jgi:two-component system cell cycle sensor histidine kinase PleC